MALTGPLAQYFCLHPTDALAGIRIKESTVRPRLSGRVGTGAHPDKRFGRITGIECPLCVVGMFMALLLFCNDSRVIH